jgi:hypothetical protein
MTLRPELITPREGLPALCEVEGFTSITVAGDSRPPLVIPRLDRAYLLLHTLKWCDQDEAAAKRMREQILNKASEGIGENPEGIEIACAIDWATTWMWLQLRQVNVSVDGSTVRLERARRQFQQATVTLARARKLLRRPYNVQVNVVTNQQVNNTM